MQSCPVQIAHQPALGRARARRGLARGLLADGQWLAAAQCFSELVAQHPVDTEARMGLAAAALGAGDGRRALRQFRWCAVQRRGDMVARTGMAQALDLLGRAEDARGILAPLAAGTPGPAAARCVFGWLLVDAARWAEADRQFAWALQQAPDLPVALAGLSAIRWAQGAPEQARALLGSALRFGDGQPRVAALRAERLMGAGQLSMARSVVARALSGRISALDRRRLVLAGARVAHLGGDEAGAAAGWAQAWSGAAYRYSPSSRSGVLQAMVDTLPAPGEHSPGWGEDAPIALVVGPAGAGAGLVARLLRSHPGVHPGACAEAMGTVVGKVPRWTGTPFPDGVGRLTMSRRAQAWAWLQRRWGLEGGRGPVPVVAGPLALRLTGLLRAMSGGLRVVAVGRDPWDADLAAWSAGQVHPLQAEAAHPEHLAHARALHAWAVAQVEARGVPVLRLDYGAVVQRPMQARARLAAFLGLQPAGEGAEPDPALQVALAEGVGQGTRYRAWLSGP